LDITKPIEPEERKPRRMSQLEVQAIKRGLFGNLKTQPNLSEMMEQKGLQVVIDNPEVQEATEPKSDDNILVH
jgi:hypothetical protein